MDFAAEHGVGVSAIQEFVKGSTPRLFLRRATLTLSPKSGQSQPGPPAHST
jgi:hypothetical protein